MTGSNEAVGGERAASFASLVASSDMAGSSLEKNQAEVLRESLVEAKFTVSLDRVALKKELGSL
jgi:hypothetical protein